MRWRFTSSCHTRVTSQPFDQPAECSVGLAFAWAAIARFRSWTVGLGAESSTVSGKRLDGLLDRGLTVTVNAISYASSRRV